jgi:hypothetical protein
LGVAGRFGLVSVPLSLEERYVGLPVAVLPLAWGLLLVMVDHGSTKYMVWMKLARFG